jgi:hypothetical protein
MNLANFLDVYNPKIVYPGTFTLIYLKQFMSTERREHAHCNEHKLVSRDSQFPWCLSCCFWYAVVYYHMWPANGPCL